jgi:hypothetical protein
MPDLETRAPQGSLSRPDQAGVWRVGCGVALHGAVLKPARRGRTNLSAAL